MATSSSAPTASTASTASSAEPTEPPTFPDDFRACEDRSYFERFSVADLAYFLLGQYLYFHTSKILVQIVEAEAYPEAQAFVYQGMFGSPCAQFKVKAGQLVARFPTQAQSAMTPQTAAASEQPLELYITGRDEHCGDVVRLISFMPVEGLAELEERLGHDNIQDMLIGKSEIAKALGAGGDVLDWDANPFLFESGGVQLFFLKKPRSKKIVVGGPRNLNNTRVGVNSPSHDTVGCFSLELDSDIHQRY